MPSFFPMHTGTRPGFLPFTTTSHIHSHGHTPVHTHTHTHTQPHTYTLTPPPTHTHTHSGASSWMVRRIEITVRSCAVWQQLAGKSPWICWSWPWNTSAVGRRHAWRLERTARGSVGDGHLTGSCAAFSQQHFRRWYLVLLSQPPWSLPLSLQPCPVAPCLPSWSCQSSTPDCRAWHFGWWSGRSKPRYSCQLELFQLSEKVHALVCLLAACLNVWRPV